jgi:prevent-host-death family protein
MTTIGASKAKVQLSMLLERVSRGERFIITKYGRPVAELLPTGVQAVPAVKHVIQQMQVWQERERPTLGTGLSIRRLREEGRRF